MFCEAYWADVSQTAVVELVCTSKVDCCKTRAPCGTSPRTDDVKPSQADGAGGIATRFYAGRWRGFGVGRAWGVIHLFLRQSDKFIELMEKL